MVCKSRAYLVQQPTEKRNAECIKLKKELKDMWTREQKKLSECKTALKAAKGKYTMLGQELARVSVCFCACLLQYFFLCRDYYW